MAVTKDDIKNTYPLPVYNYRVEIDGNALGFSEVSGLTMQTETTTYKESPIAGGAPGPKVMHMPSQSMPAHVTLKRGVVPTGSVTTLYDWFNARQTNQIDKKDVVIRLCDESGNPVISWTIVNAFPTKLDAPTFDAGSDDVALETMELMGDNITLATA